MFAALFSIQITIEITDEYIYVYIYLYYCRKYKKRCFCFGFRELLLVNMKIQLNTVQVFLNVNIQLRAMNMILLWFCLAKNSDTTPLERFQHIYSIKPCYISIMLLSCEHSGFRYFFLVTKSCCEIKIAAIFFFYKRAKIGFVLCHVLKFISFSGHTSDVHVLR